MSSTMHEYEGAGVKAAELKATVTRIGYEPNATIGVMSVTKEDGYAWACKTLELADKDNAPMISCIPAGEYECKYTRSPAFSRRSYKRWLKKNPGKNRNDCPDDVKNVYTYEIFDVPNRSGIRIHSANYTRQLRGCLALGHMHKDLDGDGTTDVGHSGKTMRTFEQLMNKQPFKIQIS